jgi:hypothetical protein
MNCLNCGKELNGAACTDGSDITPHDGDVSICLYCSEIMVFCDEEKNFRALSKEEEREILKDDRLLEALKIVSKMRGAT